MISTIFLLFHPQAHLFIACAIRKYLYPLMRG
jgi:hypothetical protein